MRTRSDGRGIRAGFTLIEVLVVAAIIALLISILLPSLSRARKQSRSVLCLANLRSVSHGWHMYADDYDDVILPGRFANLGGGSGNPANWYDVGNGRKTRPRWLATMGKYTGLYAFNKPDTANDRQNYDSKLYHCPEVPTWTDERNGAYGYNYQFLGNARLAGSEYVNWPVLRTRMKTFSGTVLGADSVGTASGFATAQRKPYNNNGTGFDELGNHGWCLDPPRLTPNADRGTGDPGSPRTAIHDRHLERTNVVYCDGHAETNTAKVLGYRTASDGAFLDTGSEAHNRLFSGTGNDDDPPTKAP
jgi:prepilin-type N-terminal cleavage/methylation domain-containing protein/prepilin-type processing-associated H-X9-DG protein